MRIQHELGGTLVTAATGGEPRAVAGGLILSGDTVQVHAPHPAHAFYRHGWQTWSPTGWVDPTARPRLAPPADVAPSGDDPGYAQRERHGGNAVGALECADGHVLIVGALSLGGRVEVDGDGDRLTAAYESGAGGEWFTAYGPEVEVFGRYAGLLAERLGRRKRPTPRVWCSWYSHYRDIDEANLGEALDGVRDLGFDVFQIDDGWQQGIGAWEPNADFPSGMDGFADRIQTAGYVPGLWLAPFIAHEHSRLFRERPQLCVRDDDGAPVSAGVNWGGHFYALDVTHPDTVGLVVDVVRRAVGWGYTYLKLDFIYAAALPGRRHEDLPREQVYRHAVDVLRETVGDEVYLLACGAPVLPSLGVFDGLRIGPDVAPYWEDVSGRRYLQDLSLPNTRSAIATSVHRIWLKPVIDIDPDVTYFRTRDNQLDDRQRGMLQDLARICGFRATSDPPSWLDAQERAQLAAFLTEQPLVRQLGRYRFAIDEHVVDFAPVASRASHWPEIVE